MDGKRLVTTGMASCSVSHISTAQLEVGNQWQPKWLCLEKGGESKNWIPKHSKKEKASCKPGWSAADTRWWAKKTQASSFSQGSFVGSLVFDLFKVNKITIKFFDLFKVSKIIIIVFFHLFKVSKITINFFDLFKFSENVLLKHWWE